jgi:hypothetical protein
MQGFWGAGDLLKETAKMREDGQGVLRVSNVLLCTTGEGHCTGVCFIWTMYKVVLYGLCTLEQEGGPSID